MTSGGSRAHSGPPPDPNAARSRTSEDEWVTLPSTGVEAPEWPLSNPPDDVTRFHWERLWTLPQANLWPRSGHEVAAHALTLAQMDTLGALTKAQTFTLVRQQEESLGLSVAGMQRNKWRFADESAPTVEPTQARNPKKPASARDRLRVVSKPDD